MRPPAIDWPCGVGQASSVPSGLQCRLLENQEADDLSGKIHSSCDSLFIAGFLRLQAVSQTTLQSVLVIFALAVALW